MLRVSAPGSPAPIALLPPLEVSGTLVLAIPPLATDPPSLTRPPLPA